MFSIKTLFSVLVVANLSTLISAVPAQQASSSPQIRDLQFNPSSPGGVVAWPNSRITWCITGSSNADIVQFMSEAWGRWKKALGSNTRIALEKTNKDTCDPNTDTSTLWVTLTSDKSARTTVGYAGKGLVQGVSKNTMDFDINDEWGLNDVVSNLSAELGHALGLPTLLGADGKLVPSNSSPSKDDVKAIKQLYNE